MTLMERLMPVPPAWFRRQRNAFAYNIDLPATATPEDCARSLVLAAEAAKQTHRHVAVWMASALLAVADREGEQVYVRIVPHLRHRIAMPWRAYVG